MDDTPPRRSRRPNDKRKDSTFPLVPFMIGVVVLGFVIGAGLSMAGRHGSHQQVVAVASATPEPTATPQATLAPLATPRPVASVADTTESSAPQTSAPDTPAASASASATAKPAVKPSVRPSARVALAPLPPSAEPTATLAAVAVKSPGVLEAPVTPVPLHSHTVATVHPKFTPPVATVANPPTPTPAPSIGAQTPLASPAAAAASVEAESDFGRLAANVVKQYLRALSRGDTESAAGAFQPGSSNAYPERAILDSTSQIGAISSRGSSETQTVNATISNSEGNYTGTYTVHRTSTGAAIIVSHSISKS